MLPYLCACKISTFYLW